MNKTKFLIVASGHNCQEYIARCVASIKSQTYYGTYDYVLVDDASTDDSLAMLYKHAPYEKVIPLNKRVGTVAAHNIGILSCTDYDVIVWLDMDDELLNCALKRLAEEYENPEVWLTYGNYVDRNGDVFFNKKNIDFSEKVHASNGYRQADWKYIHLRSFRRELYYHLTEQDLFLHSSIKAYIDYNMWICMMEMAGKEHMRGIADVLYYYNNMNPANLLRSYTPNQLDYERDFCKAITPKQKLKSL